MVSRLLFLLLFLVLPVMSGRRPPFACVFFLFNPGKTVRLPLLLSLNTCQGHRGLPVLPRILLLSGQHGRATSPREDRGHAAVLSAAWGQRGSPRWIVSWCVEEHALVASRRQRELSLGSGPALPGDMEERVLLCCSRVIFCCSICHRVWPTKNRTCYVDFHRMLLLLTRQR